MFDLRYQLLYATAGTISANADISVLYVLVFKTNLYNEKIGAKNYSDYADFLRKVGADPLPVPDNSLIGHRLTLQGKDLVCLYSYFDI